MDEKAIVVRSPETVAQEINAIKTETFRFLESAFAYASRSAWEIGRLLTEAKELVEPKGWTCWLHDNVDYSEDTAQNLMRIYREFDVLKNPSFQGLNYSQMVALFPLAPEKRAELVEKEDITGLSTRQIKQLVKQRDDALKQLEKAEKAASEAVELKGQLDSAKKRLDDALLKKAEAEKESKTQKRLADDFQKQMEELKAHPKVVEKIVHQATDAQLKQIRQELSLELRQEYDSKLELQVAERVKKQKSEEQKQELLQDSRIVEINILLTQISSLFDIVSTNMQALEKDNAELEKELRGKLLTFSKMMLGSFSFDVTELKK